MVASKAEFAVRGDEQIALRRGESLAAPRGTLRGKTHLSLAELQADVAHYPPELREPTLAVQAFFVQACNSDLGVLTSLAVDKLKFERGTTYFQNWIKGYYFGKGGGDLKAGGQGRADWLRFCKLLREYAQAGAAAAMLGTLETPTFRAIHSFVVERTAADAPCRFGGIVGPTGSQKTASLKLTALKLGFPRAVRFECPARPALGAFQRKLAEQYNARVGNRREKIEESIRLNVKPDSVLIVDNIQRAFIPHKKDDQPIFNYLLELQEDVNCTMILPLTPAFLGSLESGTAAGYFEQFVGRMGGLDNLLRLKDYTPMADIRYIARQYNLHDGEAAVEMMQKWSKMPGRVRILFAKLNRARVFAQLDGRTRVTVADLEASDTFTPPDSIELPDAGGAS